MARERIAGFIFFALACAAAAFAAGCSEEDSDDNDASVDDDDSLAADDDTGDDDTGGADDDNDMGDDDSAAPCAAPIDPPEPYLMREAAWFVARFDDETSPVLGLYAYFWLDWYTFEECSYSSNWAVLYKRGGAEGDNLVSGEFRSGFDVEFGQNAAYDVFVRPRMRVHTDAADPLLWRLELFAEEFEGQIALRVRHVKAWSPYWFAAYDAEIEDATITVGGETYHPAGSIDFERWFEIGGSAPGSDEDNFIQGSWLYEPFAWRDENGERVNTLLNYWLKFDGSNVWIHQATGTMSIGARQYEVTQLEWDIDFPENENSGGYPMRHAMSGTISDGREFSYEVSVAAEFHDDFPPEWEDLLPPGHREAHSLTEGSMQFDGRTFDGGGIYEWRVTDYNPL